MFPFLNVNTFACGNLSLVVNNITINWSQSFSIKTESITVNRTDTSKACNYFITFSRGGGASYDTRRMLNGTKTLRYQLYTTASVNPSNILKALPEASSSSEVLTGSFKRNGPSSETKNYYVDIPLFEATNPTLVAAGNYTDVFSVSVYNGRINNPPNAPDSTSTVQITSVVPKIIALSLVEPGSPFDINDTSQTVGFGTLVLGDTKGFDLRVLTNAGYSVNFSSQNNGQLKHITAPSVTVPQKAVVYTTRVNGIAYDLSHSNNKPTEVAAGGGQTPLSGQLNTVNFTIGDVQNKMAGDYSDAITVTTSTTE